MLKHVPPEHVEVEIWRADALEVRRGLSSELDEMWSDVRSKANPHWLGHAIEHHTGQVLSTWTKVLPQFTLLENQSYISFQTVGESLRPLRTDVGMTHKPKMVANNTL